MDRRLWSRCMPLLDQLVDLPEEERQRRLAEILEDDAELHDELVRLVADHDEAGPFLEVPALAVAGLADLSGGQGPGETVRGNTGPGGTIGRFRLLEEIGRGGMSIVFLAERIDGEYQQSVALKVLHPILFSRGLVERFRRERQILARLDHPNIAQLLDGGTTELGEPYLVMEHIDGGAPIDQHCDQRRLSITDRLELFLEVCSAVSAAHRQLVVHRDLKPSNILVTVDGAAKLLDFGIAKLLDPIDALKDSADPADVRRTTTGLRPMTPAYASPEQVMVEPITTASDIYSLGVVLYELLIGRLPYRLDSTSRRELERAISEQEATPPVSWIDHQSGVKKRAGVKKRGGRQGRTEVPSASEWDLPSIHRDRSARPPELRRQLAGDLETVLLTALRKNPQHRYLSVDRFADDIRRFLERRPVEARRPTVLYRFRKLVSRNRLASALVASVVTLIAIFAVAMVVQSGRTVRERDVAEMERDRAEEISTFMVELFAAADPDERQSGEVSAEDILNRGVRRIEQELGGQPILQSRLMTTMAAASLGLGRYEEATGLLGRSLALNTEDPQGDALHRAVILDQLSLAHELRGKYLSAETLASEALILRREELAPDDPLVAASLERLATVLLNQGRFDEGEEPASQTLEIRRRVLTRDDADMAASLNLLSMIYTRQGRFDEALPLIEESIEILRALRGPEHPTVLTGQHNLANVHLDNGRPEVAEKLFRRILAGREKILGEDHPKTLKTAASLATTLRATGGLEEAQELSRRGLEARRRTLGSSHPAVSNSLTTLASLLSDSGELAEAEKHYREAIEILGAIGEQGYIYQAFPLCGLGEMLCAEGRVDEAEPLLREALRLRREALAEGHPLITKTEGLLADCPLAASP